MREITVSQHKVSERFALLQQSLLPQDSMRALKMTGLSEHEAMVAVDGLGSLFAIATATVEDLVSCRSAICV